MGHAPASLPIQNSVFLSLGIARKAEICIIALRRATGGGIAAPKGAALASRRTERSAQESDKESLNFKVNSAFKKEFKGFAVSEGISMTDLLKEGFALSKKKRQK